MKYSYLYVFLLLIVNNIFAQTGQESNAQKAQDINNIIAPPKASPAPILSNQKSISETTIKDSVLNSVKDSFESITSSLEKERAESKVLQKSAQENIEKVNKLNNYVNSLQSSIRSLTNKDNSNKQAISTLQAKLDSAKRLEDEYTNRVQRLQNDYDSKIKDLNERSIANKKFKTTVTTNLKERLLSVYEKDTTSIESINKYRDELKSAKEYYKNLKKDNIDNRIDLLWLRDSSYISIYLTVQDNIQKLDSIFPIINTYKNKILELKKFKIDTTDSGDTKIYDSVVSIGKNLDSLSALTTKKSISFQESYKKYLLIINNFNQLFIKTKNNSDDISAIPNITSILGQNFITPNINLKGSTKFGTNNINGDVRIFTSAITNSQSKVSGIFVPEASNYGITVNLSYGIAFPESSRLKMYSNSSKESAIKNLKLITDEINSLNKTSDSLKQANNSIFKNENKKSNTSPSIDDIEANKIKIIGNNQEVRLLRGKRRTLKKGILMDYTPESRFPLFVYINANYLGKGLLGIRKDSISKKNDTTSYTSDVFHGKIGTQVILFKNILSLYANYNLINGIVNRAPLTEFHPSLVHGFTSYFDSGIKFFLPLGKTNPVNLYWDLDIIIVNNPIKELLKNNDSVIPNIKVGLLKSF